MLLKACKFYGWSLQDVKELPIDEFNAAWLAITIIEAQDMLCKMSIADYPHLKPVDKQKKHREMNRLAYPKSFSKKNSALTTAELARMLGKV